MSKVNVVSDKKRDRADKEKRDFVRSVIEEKEDGGGQVHLGAHDETEEIGT